MVVQETHSLGLRSQARQAARGDRRMGSKRRGELQVPAGSSQPRSLGRGSRAGPEILGDCRVEVSHARAQPGMVLAMMRKDQVKPYRGQGPRKDKW